MMRLEFTMASRYYGELDGHKIAYIRDLVREMYCNHRGRYPLCRSCEYPMLLPTERETPESLAIQEILGTRILTTIAFADSGYLFLCQRCSMFLSNVLGVRVNMSINISEDTLLNLRAYRTLACR